MKLIIKTKQTKSTIPNEGAYVAKVTSIKPLPDENNPKKVVFGFKVAGHEEEITKEVPFSFEEGTSLRKDTETLLAKQLTTSQAFEGIDLNDLIAKDCQIVVMHKSGASGKTKAVASVIMAAVQAPQPVSA